MPSEISHDAPLYYSGGSLDATAKALNEIILPALKSVRGELEARGLSASRYTIQEQHKLGEHALVLTIKAKRGFTSSLTFKRDAHKGGFQVKTVKSHPNKVTTKSATTFVVKTANSTHTRHLAESDLNRPVLEKVIADFLDAVAKLDVEALESAANDDADLVHVGEPTAPRLSTAQREQVLRAMSTVLNSTDKEPGNRPRLEEQLNNQMPLTEVYNWNALIDVKRLLWQLYLHHAAHDGVTKRLRNPTKRRKAATGLRKELKTTPTTAILKATYPSITQLDEETCAQLNADLKRLTT